MSAGISSFLGDTAYQTGLMIAGGAAVTTGSVAQMSGVVTKLASLPVGAAGLVLFWNASNFDLNSCPSVYENPDVNALNCAGAVYAMALISILGITGVAAPIIYQAGDWLSDTGSSLRDWGFKQIKVALA